MSFQRTGDTSVGLEGVASSGRVGPKFRSVVVAVVCGLVAVGMTGCSRNEGAGETTTTGPPPPTSTAPTTGPPGTTATTLSPDQVAQLSDEDQIRYVLDTYWSEWLLLGQHLDLNRQSFFSLLTGDFLAGVTKTVADTIAQGRTWRLPAVNPRFAHRVERLTLYGDAMAAAYECVVDDLVVSSVKDGTVVNDATRTNLYLTTLTKASGRWQITKGETVDLKEGEQPCATP
jgi:hypothetical protein